MANKEWMNEWMNEWKDNLLLNNDKTEFLIIFFTETPAPPTRTSTPGMKTWNWLHRHNIVSC